MLTDEESDNLGSHLGSLIEQMQAAHEELGEHLDSIEDTIDSALFLENEDEIDSGSLSTLKTQLASLTDTLELLLGPKEEFSQILSDLSEEE